MQDESLKIVVSGLMHDIGKIVYRTGDGRQHSLTGMEFLRDEAGIHDKSILEAVRYHHGAELRGAHIPNDSPAYIIYIADNIASASDRRKSDGKESGFDRQVPLESIFNILNGNHGNKHYHPEATQEMRFLKHSKVWMFWTAHIFILFSKLWKHTPALFRHLLQSMSLRTYRCLITAR